MPHRLEGARRRVVVALAAALSGACAAGEPGTDAMEWRIGFVAPPGAETLGALRGAELGVVEAAHAGELVGRGLALDSARADGPEAAVRAARRLREAGAFAVIGGFDEPTCRALSDWAEREAALFLNVGCRADRLRERSRRNTFHVEASESMYRAAAADTPRAEPVLWHPSLSRYGAAQLNDRFLERFGTPPGAPEWTSWMAVKLVWEALLRTGSTDADALATFLEDDEARFDGHKGQPLGFDGGAHQLLQPLYLADPRTGDLLDAGPDGATAASDLPTTDEIRLGAGPHLFVSNEGSGDVTVVDARAHRAVARIPLGHRPRGIRVAPGGARVYVALSDDAPLAESDGDAIAEIALPGGSVVRRHPAGSDPEQFAVSPDGSRLYAANEDAGTASIADLSTGEVLATLVVGIEPEGVAVSPDGRWVYVTAETSNTVSVIDTRAGEVVASFLVDVRPRGVAFSPTRPRAYVTNEISGTVSVVDVEAHRVVGTIRLEDGLAKPVGVAVSPDGARVYVANGHAHSVSVIDAESDRVVRVVPVGRRPWGVAVSADGRYVYTANGGSDDVSVVDAATLEVVATIPVGARPWGVAIAP